MSTKITYTRQGDYYLPDLKLPEQEPREIGIWDLADINEEAQNMYDRLVKQLAEQEGVTEKLKGEDPLEWVAKMNNINSRASEIVFAEIIYTV
ncbi:TnpV protein [uncultured Ruminococcus sp.]|uniref:TnpV protein n=1 Tax=uncultured Ruminococcus sp. TaxID=165186 RepID=UPI00293179B0|nr:TnpV protein [uncultured Ruminococcus sp.]